MTNLIFLKNKTVPSDPYEELSHKLELNPQFIPLLTHTHLDKSEIVKYITSAPYADETDAFIITSQRAVECLNECMSLIKDESVKQQILAKPGYTVGPATAEILARAGFQDIRGGADAGNGSLLADIILQDLSPEKHKLLFFTGEIRKDIIPKKLTGKGFDLTERVIYRTEPRHDIVEKFDEACAKLSPEDESWLVFFSPQGTETFVEYLQQKSDGSLNFKVASIGPTTEQYLKENAIVPQIVASKPTAQALLDQIQSYPSTF